MSDFVVLKPGDYTIVHKGKGKPGKGRPSKCLHCLKSVNSGEWVTRDNGLYITIAHRACESSSRKVSAL